MQLRFTWQDAISRNGQKGDDNGGDDGFIEWFSKQQNKTLKWYFIQEKVYENFANANSDYKQNNLSYSMIMFNAQKWPKGVANNLRF